MELIYTDENGTDINEMPNGTLDLAFGIGDSPENSFAMEIPLAEHCMEKNYRLYIAGTEYGGIVDAIEPNEDDDLITYYGRTWHGVLAGRIIEPPEGEDYRIFDGEANEVLAEIIELLDIGDLFEASTEDSEIEISGYQMERYVGAYQGICDMLYDMGGRLKIVYDNEIQKVILSAEELINYSELDEFDTTQLIKKLKRTYNTTNHMICAGSGDLAERYIIHLFTDEEGGVQEYATTDTPLQDSDYILDTTNQILFGTEEIAEYYDYGNAQTTTNYILLTSQPSDWAESAEAYYTYDEDDDKYSSVKQESENVNTLLTSQPSDWSKNYGNYYYYNDNGNLSGVQAEETESYKKLTSKPSDWAKNYSNYYYLYTDGVSSEYKSVSGKTKNNYKIQTKKPTDWDKSYSSYYKKNKKGKYESVTKKSKTNSKGKKVYYVPNWKKNTYYTNQSTTVSPNWDTSTYTYYRKVVTESAPTFKTNTYYTKETIYYYPAYVSGTYYEAVYDHYAQMVEEAVESLNETALERDELSVDLSEDEEVEYYINDVVSGIDDTTEIEVIQKVTKKIVKIVGLLAPTITYEVG